MVSATSSLKQLEFFLEKNKADCDVLARLQPLPTDGEVVFEAVPHLYKLRLDAKQWLPLLGSVSSLLSLFFPEFSREALLRIIASRQSRSEEEIAAKWDAARDDGTRLHPYIESFYNDVITAVPGLVPEKLGAEYIQFHRFHESVVLAKGWVHWLTELYLLSRKYLVVFSCDMLYLCPRTGGLYLVDWKRSKQLRKTPYRAGETDFSVGADLPNANCHKYTMQLNFYRLLAERQTGRPVLGMFLAVFHPRQNDFYFEQVPDRKKKALQFVAIRRHHLWLCYTNEINSILQEAAENKEQGLGLGTAGARKIRTYLCYLGLLSKESGLAGTELDASCVTGWPALRSRLLDRTSLRLRAGALPLCNTLGVGHIKKRRQLALQLFYAALQINLQLLLCF
eukprot:g72702.t1